MGFLSKHHKKVHSYLGSVWRSLAKLFFFFFCEGKCLLIHWQYNGTLNHFRGLILLGFVRLRTVFTVDTVEISTLPRLCKCVCMCVCYYRAFSWLWEYGYQLCKIKKKKTQILRCAILITLPETKQKNQLILSWIACQTHVKWYFLLCLFGFFFNYSCRIFHRAYVAESSKLWIHQSVVTFPVLKIKVKDRCR